jgi:ABC-type multidrug transport system ATPase subunit
MPTHAIEARNLVKTYARKKKDETRAVDDVSFTVRPGEIFGLLGPNGAGKSTTVRILTTILQPSAGTAFVMGHDVRTDPLNVRRNISVVLQETAVETLLSVQDNLKIYGKLHGKSGSDLDRKIHSVLEQFELTPLRAEKAQDLSIGFRRRLQVAKIFLLDTPIVFLDEATTGMDPLIKRQTLESIHSMAKAGRTVFLTTQLLSEAEELCDQIVIMNQGKTIASGDLNRLRELSTSRFHISLTLAESSEEAQAALRKMTPTTLHVVDRDVEMVFQGDEPAILERLAAFSSKWRLERFEIRGADLEEIFVELISGKS